jgi:hypothetical protein
MPESHRATPEQWAEVRSWSGITTQPYAHCLLELRARIEALEAAQQDKLDRLIALDQEAAMDELRAASAEARPAGGLVERVAYAMGPQSQAAMDAGELPHGTARAAIREVVAWLRDGGDYSANAWANLLEDEADRG